MVKLFDLVQGNSFTLLNRRSENDLASKLTRPVLACGPDAAQKLAPTLTSGKDDLLRDSSSFLYTYFFQASMHRHIPLKIY